VAVGDELLLGTTVDTNGAWLGMELAELGVPVLARHTVGDRVEEIARGIREGLERADLVVVTGGLGPTHDDVTREAAAGLLEAPLRLDPELESRLRGRWRSRGLPFPETNLRQAMVPSGAELLANPLGTAPGLLLSAGGGRIVILLPGIPREMRGIWNGAVVPLLRERWGGRLSRLHYRVLHTTGIPESRLAELVEPLFGMEVPRGVEVAFLPRITGVDLRLSAAEGREEGASRLLDRAEGALREVAGRWLFQAASGDLVDAVAQALKRAGASLVTAESCTGGLVAKRLTDRPGSSSWYCGGIVAYDNRVKVRELGVPEALIREHGAVSREVAEAMVRGAAERFQVEAAVSVTGVAGPGGGSPEKPVGTVWYAAQVGDTVRSRVETFPGDRVDVRERSAQAVLALLLRTLEGGEVPTPPTGGAW